jgi:Ca-activated chloride channel family protein
MKTWIISVLAICLFTISSETDYTFKGTVTAASSGEPLIGASILIKNTTKGTVTGLDGSFSLLGTDSCHTLVISYTGFETTEVKACYDLPLKISLKTGMALDEVVVMGNPQRKERERKAERRVSAEYAGAPASMMAPPPPPSSRPYTPSPEPTNGDNYATITENDFIPTSKENISTFAIDVDAASYSNVRRFLNEGQLPPADAVRSEEMINYFQYNYPPPTAKSEHPFAISTELASCPWNSNSQLLLVGMRAEEIAKEDLPAANFVFLLDVSGSMNRPDALPLLVESMKILTDNLRPEDRVAIVVYAGASGLVLESTSGDNKTKIKDALSRLTAGGSTAGAAGIQQAYAVARENFIEGGNNRVILATDGDFNVGISDNGSLETLIEKERESGIFLSVLGFGRGNLQDDKMQLLADKGNGNHAYIDQLSEAKKVLVTEFGGTLFTVAKDVKIQVEFNPTYVASYRLIGYENRLMANEDFRNDAKDAGELGAGHTITALYEITPSLTAGATDAAAIVRLRYKQPTASTASELAYNVDARTSSFGQSSTHLRWAATVAEFAMLLRDSKHKGTADYDHCEEIARQSAGRDPFGYRKEMIELIGKAKKIKS